MCENDDHDGIYSIEPNFMECISFLIVWCMCNVSCMHEYAVVFWKMVNKIWDTMPNAMSTNYRFCCILSSTFGTIWVKNTERIIIIVINKRAKKSCRQNERERKETHCTFTIIIIHCARWIWLAQYTHAHIRIYLINFCEWMNLCWCC